MSQAFDDGDAIHVAILCPTAGEMVNWAQLHPTAVRSFETRRGLLGVPDDAYTYTNYDSDDSATGPVNLGLSALFLRQPVQP